MQKAYNIIMNLENKEIFEWVSLYLNKYCGWFWLKYVSD